MKESNVTKFSGKSLTQCQNVMLLYLSSSFHFQSSHATFMKHVRRLIERIDDLIERMACKRKNVRLKRSFINYALPKVQFSVGCVM